MHNLAITSGLSKVIPIQCTRTGFDQSNFDPSRKCRVAFRCKPKRAPYDQRFAIIHWTTEADAFEIALWRYESGVDCRMNIHSHTLLGGMKKYRSQLHVSDEASPQSIQRLGTDSSRIVLLRNHLPREARVPNLNLLSI